MLSYEIRFSYRHNEILKNNEKKADKSTEEVIVEEVRRINRQLIDRKERGCCCFIFRADTEGMSAAIVSEKRVKDAGSVVFLKDLICELADVDHVKLNYVEEITMKELSSDMDLCFDSNLCTGRRRFFSGLNLDFDSTGFHLEEMLIDDKKLSKADADREAEALMADSSLWEELDRIYSNKNRDAFYGFPVHYHIVAGNRQAAQDIIMLMEKALYSRGRIPARRISNVTEIGNSCYDDSAMENLLKNSGFSAVAIEMKGEGGETEYATDYERVVSYLAKRIRYFHQDTLFFLIEITEGEGFGKKLLAKLSDEMDFMTIKEGRGDKEEAVAYLKRLITGSRYADLMDDEVFKKLSDRNSFCAADVHRVFDEWKRHCLKDTAYRAYHGYRCPVEKKKHKKQKAYEHLMSLTGLEEVKDLTEQILAFYRIRKKCERYSLGNGNLSRHMVFTGNPGSAKTTVARLLAEVLAEEGILDTGAFVECGRANLVGKYVGWTARHVKQRFQEARGGILFIDEAYSLLEDHHSYGDEAINTIVQEMENQRNDVIVIFAGYREPMENFINRNEGLRSRIAFRVSFPDYNAEELTQILLGMAKEQGLVVEETALEKCREIFYNVCGQKDFGNGRFVRNLFERALLNQAVRLGGKSGKLTKAMLASLKSEDFDAGLMNLTPQKKSQTIGFL